MREKSKTQAHKVLKTWYQSLNNRQEAYKNLYTALYSNGWSLLSGELKQWVEGTKETSPLLDSGKPLSFFIFHLGNELNLARSMDGMVYRIHAYELNVNDMIQLNKILR